MSSSENGECIIDTKEDAPASRTRLMDYIPIYIPAIEQELLNQNHSERRFLDFLRARPSTDWFFTHRRFRVPFVRYLDWRALIRYFKKWIKNPANIALVIWLMFVAAGLFMLFLVTIGSLNKVIPSSTKRKKWIEIINQILNALFTIMCIYQHPNLFHHLVLLCRWRLPDRAELRAGYCKDGSRRAHERAHIMLVVILLHITIFSQYVLCGLYWGYSRKDRPDWAVNLCTGIGIAAPAIAGVYTVFSPLGRRKSDEPPEPQNQVATAPQEVQPELVIYNRRVVVTDPEWIGGLFDCGDDRTVCLASFFCTCCVFGWNMERLALGNMYVHIVTFLLLIVAPLMVFSVSALNVENYAIRYIVGVSGILLGVFGLLYGGIWRTQMRKRFKLPANPFCCGYPTVTDLVQWLFCWSCSLAQEVRTANFYDIEEDSFCKNEDGQPVLVPLPREAGSGFLLTSNGKLLLRSFSCPATLDPLSLQGGANIPPHLSHLRSSTHHVMAPPPPALMQIDEA